MGLDPSTTARPTPFKRAMMGQDPSSGFGDRLRSRVRVRRRPGLPHFSTKIKTEIDSTFSASSTLESGRSLVSVT